jgi:lysophospholipase L1-like esterase
VIGDSTASPYAADLYRRMGWAQPLQDYYAPACAAIQDRAISGRSSKSFFDEGAWTPVRDALKSGDFVLIQFGHNDEKSMIRCASRLPSPPSSSTCRRTSTTLWPAAPYRSCSRR